MPLTWEEICSKLRSTFGTLINEENVGRLLVNLFPLYRATLEGKRFHEADAIYPIPYCRILSKLLGRGIVAISTVSLTDPSRRPDFWNEGVGRDALTSRNHDATDDVVHCYFDTELLHARTLRITYAAVKHDGSPINPSTDCTIQTFVEEALGDGLSSLAYYQSNAIVAAIRLHLWASVTDDQVALADLEPFLPCLLTAPPIGTPRVGQHTCLVLVR